MSGNGVAVEVELVVGRDDMGGALAPAAACSCCLDCEAGELCMASGAGDVESIVCCYHVYCDGVDKSGVVFSSEQQIMQVAKRERQDKACTSRTSDTAFILTNTEPRISPTKKGLCLLLPSSISFVSDNPLQKYASLGCLVMKNNSS